MGYHKAFVIFIDILGTKERENDFVEMYKINTIFHEQLEQEQQMDAYHPHVVYERTVHTFSDCAYIIYDFKEGTEEYLKDIYKLMAIACYNTEKLCFKFLEEGFVFRGGMSFDDVYYEKNRSLLFGPAVNTAYLLEDKVAKYPRIVLDKKIAKELFSYLNDVYGFEKDNGTILKIDKDNNYFLHYLNSYELGMKQPLDIDFRDNTYELCKKEIEKAKVNIKLTEEQKEGIIAKYDWLYDYVTVSQFKGLRYTDMNIEDADFMKQLAIEEMEMVNKFKQGRGLL